MAGSGMLSCGAPGVTPGPAGTRTPGGIAAPPGGVTGGPADTPGTSPT